MQIMQSSQISADDAIRSTNDDATSCKRSAVEKGYWTDPYLKYFMRSADRKQPEINRGYYARVIGIRLLLRQFLKLTKCECQIVNIGAGFDTLLWNLQDEGLQPSSLIEVDFPGVTTRKLYYIKRSKELLERISTPDAEIQLSTFDLHAGNYHIVSADLRHNLNELEQKFTECHIDYSKPTIFIAECVLVYLEAEKSSVLLKWITDKFNTAFFINYEQANMGDRFGQVMMENLQARQCKLGGVDHCASLHTQMQRFLSNGWGGADAWLMTTVYQNLPQADVQRIEKLEFLDERELLDQLFQHYCICWAYKDTNSVGLHQISLATTH